MDSTENLIGDLGVSEVSELAGDSEQLLSGLVEETEELDRDPGLCGEDVGRAAWKADLAVSKSSCPCGEVEPTPGTVCATGGSNLTVWKCG